MKNKKIQIIGLIVILLAIISFLLFSKNKKDVIVYADMDVLYEKFELAQQYNRKVESFHQASQIVLDSIETEINALIKYNSSPYLVQAKKEQYFTKRNEFEQSYQNQATQYSEKVMKQLTQYINEFSEEKGYSYVLSKQQKGQVLYADDKNDITSELLIFCNNRYKGIK